MFHPRPIPRLKLGLKVSQLENEIYQLKRKKDIKLDGFRENHKKQFIKAIHKNSQKKLILKSQQRFRSEKRNAFTEEVTKTVLSANDDKRIQQSVDSICHGAGLKYCNDSKDFSENRNVGNDT